MSALLFAFAAAACGGVADPMDDAPDAGDVVDDTTAPTIVSTSPTDGAAGQPADLAVTIQFSEPMDRDSVEGTLDTTDLGDVTLAWNAAGDTLTITPDQPLAYAEGQGNVPDVIEPLGYRVVMGNAALDLAGNELGTGIMISFTTLRSMATVMPLQQAMTRSLNPEAELQNEEDDPLVIGDYLDDDAARAVFTFPINDLPQGVHSIVSATFATRQLVGDMSGLPFGDGADDEGLGDALLIDHVSYLGLDNAAFNASQTAHAQLGAFATEGQVVIEHDVTAALADDLANRADRGNKSQYLLRFTRDTDEDGKVDRVVIDRDTSELQITYLIP